MHNHYQSLIFVGKNEKLEDFLMHKFSLKSEVSPDLLIVRRKNNKKNLGIGELSELKDFALLKSYTSNEKIIRIEDGETLTIEAQNSLLKILEEPPLNTIIIIRCNKFPNLLNTIFSRCELIDSTHILEYNYSDTISETKQSNGLEVDFLEIPFYQRLELINKITSLKNPEEKQKSIDNLLISITKNLIRKLENNIEKHDKISELEQKISKVKEIRQKIRQNVNIKLSLDNLALIGNSDKLL